MLVYICKTLHSLITHMAGCACRRCRCASAEGCLAKLCRKTLSYSVHSFQHFIEWNQLAYSGKGRSLQRSLHLPHRQHYGSDKDIRPVRRPGRRPDRSMFISTVEPASRHAQACRHQLDSRAGRHCGCDADLSLTAADRACNGCVAHGKVADRRRR